MLVAAGAFAADAKKADPKKAAPARPIVGVVCARSSFLSPRGLTADVPLYADKSWLSQHFMVPAENIGTVGITLRRGEHLHNSRRPMLDIRIKRPRGKIISQRTIPVAKLATEGQVTLALPLIFRPAGGEELCFELRLREKRSCACRCGKGPGSNAKPASVYARALVQASFPFIKAGMEEIKGETPLGEVVDVEALALSFEVGGARLYRVKSLLSRGFVMIKDGEWGRLSRAVFRRLPGLMGKVREHLLAR